MPKKRLIVLASLVVALALCLVTILTVTAHSPATSPTQARRVPGLKQGYALNWSGYAVETSLTNPASNVVSDVKGQWTVPTVTGTRKAAYSSTWVGIDGYADATVEQIGTEQDWTGRTGSYYAWYEMYPSAMRSISTVPVRPGDTISAEVSYQATTGYFVLTIQDETTGKSFTTTLSAPSAQRESAEWIFEAPSSRSGVLPLTDFGTGTMSAASATIAGQTGSINTTSWQNDPITMISPRGTVKAAPSALSTDGTSFSVTWKSS